MEKIVCVGIHKTGTTSLGAALRLLGYRMLGWNNVSASLYKRGHADALIDVMHDFDGFEDAPWYLLYEKAYERFPDVKFILTTRRDMDAWYGSLVKHLERSPAGRFSFIDTIYGTLDIANNRQLFIDTHLKHIDKVCHFADKHNVPLLKVCWENGDGWPELCTFLGKPEPEAPFPHLNAARHFAGTPLLRQMKRRLRLGAAAR